MYNKCFFDAEELMTDLINLAAGSMNKYSPKTKVQYLHWIKEFIEFHDNKNPDKFGIEEVESFLKHIEKEKSVSTLNQVISAIRFLYKKALMINPLWLGELTRIKQPERIPLILTPEEAHQVIVRIKGMYGLMAKLLYTTGIKSSECGSLRINDIDRNIISVRQGKTIRAVWLTDSNVTTKLQEYLEQRRAQFDDDVRIGKANVFHNNTVTTEWRWQYLFPAKGYSTIDGLECRCQVDEKSLQRAIQEVSKSAGIKKQVTPQTLRHSFAVNLLAEGCEIEELQKILGHKFILSTKAYTLAMKNKNYIPKRH